MRPNGTIPLLLAVMATACSPPPDGTIDPAALTAAAGIAPAALEQHMRWLADDALEGRETGTVGHRMAADYVVGRFAALGLEPAGEQGGFLQSVPVRSSRLEPSGCALTLVRDGKRQALGFATDYIARGDFARERVELTAPLVYAGFGVVATQRDHDDYDGIDVAGKVVVIWGGAPTWLPHDERAYHSMRSLKYREAVERGAVGVLEMALPEDRRRVAWGRMVRQADQPAMRWIAPDGDPREAFTELGLVAHLSAAGEQALFAHDEAGHAAAIELAERGHPEPFELGVELQVRTSSRLARLVSSNVVGRLVGSDPQLRDEHVVLTAHLDHLGRGAPVDGDAIYNGAYDNASGIAALLEIARALAELPTPPARSLLFIAVTGEEQGLLGSDYFAQHPTVSAQGLVANLNLDMVLMLHPLVDVVAFGADHSSLARPLEIAADASGIALASDPLPEEALFIRSDQFSFVRRGVPGLLLVSGFEDPDPQLDGLRIFTDWLRSVYHAPSDDMSQQFDFEAGAEFARLNLLVLHLVASQPARPQWNPGDFFGERFGHGLR